MPAPSSRQNPQIAVDEFDARYPIGVTVLVRRDNGDMQETTTRSRAEVLSGHSAVIRLEGVSGCYLLDRVTPKSAIKGVVA
jgi:hypothetical protein